jgi:hypothetical protein
MNTIMEMSDGNLFALTIVIWSLIFLVYKADRYLTNHKEECVSDSESESPPKFQKYELKCKFDSMDTEDSKETEPVFKIMIFAVLFISLIAFCYFCLSVIAFRLMIVTTLVIAFVSFIIWVITLFIGSKEEEEMVEDETLTPFEEMKRHNRIMEREAKKSPFQKMSGKELAVGFILGKTAIDKLSKK